MTTPRSSAGLILRWGSCSRAWASRSPAPSTDCPAPRGMASRSGSTTDSARRGGHGWTPSAQPTTDRLPSQDELAELAEALADSGLVDFVAADLDDTPQHAQLVAAMGDAVIGARSAVPLLLEARLAELRGDGVRMLSLLEQAVAADPTNQDAAAELGDLRSVAGDAAEADRLYRLGGLDPLADEVVLVRHFLAPPADGPARNKPCSCGSGKKYKVCHGRTAAHPLPDRAPWLWRKIMMFVQRPPNRGELLSWAGLLAGTDPEDREAVSGAMSDPTTHDFATFEGGLLERFIATWGHDPAPRRARARRAMAVVSTALDGGRGGTAVPRAAGPRPGLRRDARDPRQDDEPVDQRQGRASRATARGRRRRAAAAG